MLGNFIAKKQTKLVINSKRKKTVGINKIKINANLYYYNICATQFLLISIKEQSDNTLLNAHHEKSKVPPTTI